MTILDRLDSNWSREEREKLNNNWTIIESYLSNLQGQINFLTGNVNVQELIDQLKSLLSQGTIIIDELKSALINVEEIIVDAKNATNDANDAAQSALNAVNDIQSMLDNFQVRGTYDNDTVYSKNNSVFYEGSSYIYTNNTPSKGNSPPNYPIVTNTHWQMTAAKGASGDGAVSKVNGKEPDGTGEVILTASDVGAASAEQLEQMKTTVDNSWQKDAFNDTDITNLSNISASRVFYITGWEAPASNIEQVSIVIPAENFSGTVKVSVVGNWNNTNAFGAFECVTHYAKLGGTLHSHQRTILKADEKITTNYYFPDFNFNASVFTIPIIRKPNAINNLSVKVELLTTQHQHGTFEMLKNATIVFEELTGYSWTPQTSSFATLDKQNAFTNQSPIVFTPPNQYHHIMHKSADGALHIAPSTEINGVGWNFDNSFRLDPNGYGSIKGLIVDGVDLKQSVSNGKAQVASAITGKGVQTASDATFETMANNINAIPSGKKQTLGTFYMQALSPGQSGSASVNVGFIAQNIMAGCGGLIRLGGTNRFYAQSGSYNVSNIVVSGTTITFTITQGSLAGNSNPANYVEFFASE